MMWFSVGEIRSPDTDSSQGTKGTSPIYLMLSKMDANSTPLQNKVNSEQRNWHYNLK